MIIGNTFEQYLISKGIDVVDQINFELKSKEITEEMLLEQIRIMNEFHHKVRGSTSGIKERLDSRAGRVVESFKVNIKKLKRDIDRFQSEGANNLFEEIILYKGEDYIKRGEKVIKNIYEDGYYDLILRSMKNKEICLEDVDFNNLGKESKIQVRNIKKSSYNMVEIDCYNLLYKYKKKGLDVNFKKLVEEFCELEGLKENSYQFIIACLSFPYEVTRQCNNYRLKKKELGDDEYVLKLQKAIIQDSMSLL
ncbi:spore coat protein [Clostridium sp. MSJ-11]|uniref:Spore coat protein n=1 Tax=Clostridium mobile TaxID=2841512 RepID=A0ABS6EMA0_9CLOT|nr:spore coat protein [Clostridium mobile]MBU5486163.1 spore coat protein [Clostridium mobile]